MLSKKHIYQAALATFFLITSCAYAPTRQIQNINSNVEKFNQNPVTWALSLTESIQKSSGADIFCNEQVIDETQMLAKLDFDNLNKEQMKISGAEWLQKSFLLKKSINSKLPEMSKECRSKLVTFFRALRQAEDYIGELAYNEKSRNAFDIDFKKVPVPILEEKKYSPYQTTPEYRTEKGFQFESGDVVLTRGISFVSATISQTTDDQSHYSHGVFFHRDAKTGKTQTIESYLQQGVELYSLEDALKNENVRIMVFKPHDRELGVKASNIMYDKVVELKKKNKFIPYDYDMDFVNHDKMTCGEIIVASYEWASDGKFIIPDAPSAIRFKNPYVLKKLNLTEPTTFSPVNVEVDPRFELVMEWRDYSLVRDQRQKDMIMKKMFEWMEHEDYVLQGTLTTAGLRAIWLTRNIPFVWNILSKPLDITKIPKDTPINFLVVVAQLKSIGEKLLKDVKNADLKYEKQNGVPMSETRLLDYIENLRIQDRENFKENKSSILHPYLRPKNLFANPSEGM